MTIVKEKWSQLRIFMSFRLACCILCNASNERDEDQDRLTYDKKSKVNRSVLEVYM